MMTKPYNEVFNGTLWALLRWQQWADLCAHISAGGDPWYFYAVGEALPSQALVGPQLTQAVTALDALLRKDHQDEHLGIVYADDLSRPSLVKIYDPHHMGGCGGGNAPPGWVLSCMPPELIEISHPRPENRRRWWRELQASLAEN